MKEEKEFQVSDIHTAAWLSLSGLIFSLVIKKGKVFFTFNSSPDLFEKLQEFQEGALVDVNAFSRELRRLRARMYEKKAEHEEG